jgi:hypothetical protein
LSFAPLPSVDPFAGKAWCWNVPRALDLRSIVVAKRLDCRDRAEHLPQVKAQGLQSFRRIALRLSLSIMMASGGTDLTTDPFTRSVGNSFNFTSIEIANQWKHNGSFYLLRFGQPEGTY